MLEAFTTMHSSARNLGCLGTYLQPAFIFSVIQRRIPYLEWQTANMVFVEVLDPHSWSCLLRFSLTNCSRSFSPFLFFFLSSVLFTCEFPHSGFFAQHHFNIPF